MSALEGLVVRRSTTEQQVADGLSERILAGAFTPGDRLRESAIAAEVGVARNTVREAVRILELSGLVQFPAIGELPYLLSLPGHGFYWFGLRPGDAA